jgi:hypothetical protein
MPSDRVVAYTFSTAEGAETRLTLAMHPERLILHPPETPSTAQWLRLDAHQCANCPLAPATTPVCPAAVHLEPVLKAFNTSASYDPISLTVATPERTVHQQTTVQNGVSSLIGLIFPTSGCPRLAPFRPMARFHLPLATLPETLFRSTGMYLLAQYFRHRRGGAPDWDMSGLLNIYRHLEVVNDAMTKRLRLASETDSTVNAVILLDMLAKMFPEAIEDALEEIRDFFHPLFSNDFRLETPPDGT